MHCTPLRPVSEINISLPIFCFITGAKRRARGTPSCNNVTLITSAPRWGHPLQEQCLAGCQVLFPPFSLSVFLHFLFSFVRSFLSVLSSCLSVYLYFLWFWSTASQPTLDVFTVVRTSFSYNPTFLCRYWSCRLYCLHRQGWIAVCFVRNTGVYLEVQTALQPGRSTSTSVSVSRHSSFVSLGSSFPLTDTRVFSYCTNSFIVVFCTGAPRCLLLNYFRNFRRLAPCLPCCGIDVGPTFWVLLCFVSELGRHAIKRDPTLGSNRGTQRRHIWWRQSSPADWSLSAKRDAKGSCEINKVAWAIKLCVSDRTPTRIPAPLLKLELLRLCFPSQPFVFQCFMLQGVGACTTYRVSNPWRMFDCRPSFRVIIDNKACQIKTSFQGCFTNDTAPYCQLFTAHKEAIRPQVNESFAWLMAGSIWCDHVRKEEVYRATWTQSVV